MTYITELWLRFYWRCGWCCLCHCCFWWAKHTNFSRIIIIWIHAFFILRMPNNNGIGGKEHRQNKCAQWKMPVCHLHCRIMHTAVKYDTIQHHTNGMNWFTLAGAFFCLLCKKRLISLANELKQPAWDYYPIRILTKTSENVYQVTANF